MALNPSNTQLPIDWDLVSKYQVHDATAQPIQFGSLFIPPTNIKNEQASPSTPGTAQNRVLVVFIRHFFCGFCQEYLRRLINEPLLSTTNLALHNLQVVVVGCGAPSLIPSYRAEVALPIHWNIYTDPSTDLYRLLGMHRTMSMGSRRPNYVQRSMTGGMLRSIVQGVKRIPEGDVGGGGSLSVNGGEFLFTFQDDQQTALSSMNGWHLTWCHRMQNSRDHTEMQDLLSMIGLTSTPDQKSIPITHPTRASTIRTQSTPVLTHIETSALNEDGDTVATSTKTSSLRRSLSIRRQSWINRTGPVTKPSSIKRRSMIIQPTQSTAVAA